MSAIIATTITLPTFMSTMISIIVATIGIVGIRGMRGTIATRARAGMCAQAIMTTIIGIGRAARAGAAIMIRGGIVTLTTAGAALVGVGMIPIGAITPTHRAVVRM